MKKKILLLFLTLFLLFLAGVFITLRVVYQTTANLDFLIALHKVEIIRQELVISVQTVQSNLYTTGTLFGKELDVIVDNVLTLRGSARTCVSCHHSPEIEKSLNELVGLTEQYEEALSYFITSTADVERIERLQTLAADIGDNIIAKSQDMAITANENLQKRSADATVKVSRTKNVLALTIFLAFSLSLAIAVYLIKCITEPVAELIQATRRIRAGDLGYLSSYRGRDEFGELMESFNDMSSNLKKNHEAILSHLVRNQTILQASTDGFLLFDEQGKILDSNPALCRMVGYARDELLTMNVNDIEVFENEFETDDIWKRIKNAKSMIMQMEQKSKDGLMTTVEISATYTEIEGMGNFFCFIRDISERKKMEQELLKMQKLESIGVLAGGVAHDFNNLLTGIMGYIDLSLMQLDPKDKIHGRLENAKKATLRAQNLTHQLLTFSRGGEPIMQSVEVAQLIEESTTFVLSGSNTKCVYLLPPNLHMIEADKGQIGQVIQNIAINAKQAMAKGGVLTVRAENVTIGADDLLPLRDGDYVKLSFVDQGAGIDPEHVPKIFDPYFTTKPAGNGLGLAICHSIVLKHRGHLAVESTMGVGSTFTIYLPAKGKKSPVEQELPEKPLRTGKGRILVMDDEEYVREVLGAMLTHLGFEADFASDGATAVDMHATALRKGRPYLAVIMDLTIPGGMGGKEAVREMLAIDPETRAIVSSGYSNDPVMAEHRKYGFSGVVSKPFDTEQLSSVLHGVLNMQ